jgi:xanthine dehydrogenase accessory factor
LRLSPRHYTDPADILGFLLAAAARGEGTALVLITSITGGGIRPPGAMMAIAGDGRVSGYVSNGCVDADVVFQAREAIAADKPRTLIYGEGSPFHDVNLPCGGRLELLVLPNPDLQVIQAICTRLIKRSAVTLEAGIDGLTIGVAGARAADWDGARLAVKLKPRLRLRIAGRGTEPLALARLASVCGYDVHLQSPDEEGLGLAIGMGLATDHLMTPDTPPQGRDDPWTAFVLMFHEHEWELALLLEAIAGLAFYIGALGSRRTHERRCAALREAGVMEEHIARIHAPIGLVAKARDAQALAISALAEVTAAWQAVGE